MSTQIGHFMTFEIYECNKNVLKCQTCHLKSFIYFNVLIKWQHNTYINKWVSACRPYKLIHKPIQSKVKTISAKQTRPKLTSHMFEQIQTQSHILHTIDGLLHHSDIDISYRADQYRKFRTTRY